MTYWRLEWDPEIFSNFANQFKRILSEQRIRAQCSLSTYL